jgi:hypothetical protein
MLEASLTLLARSTEDQYSCITTAKKEPYPLVRV